MSSDSPDAGKSDFSAAVQAIVDSGTDADALEALGSFETFLTEARARADSGSPTGISIRRLLRFVDAERRGPRVIEQIQRALDAHELRTDPSFTSGWVDNRVVLRLATPGLATDAIAAPEPDAGGTAPAEVSLTVGSLESASAGVVDVERTSDLQRARALMLRHDYSQLAVMSGPRQLVGAVSWESIAKAAICRPDVTLGDATVQARQVEPDDDLIALIPTIVDKGFVFVVGSERKLTGIVTTADLSSQFATLAKPFLLVGEIERRLRQVLSAEFQTEDFAAAKDPRDTTRTITSADDLTLGETTRFFEDPARWSRLGWPLERGEFIEALAEVKGIRNEVMHFSPDPLSADQDASLLNFVGWLKVLDPGR